MKKWKLNLLILLALLGIGVSAYLTLHHFQILREGLLGHSFCSFNDRFDCDSVMMSRYSKFLGLPVAGLGVIYFFYLLFPLLYARLALDTAQSTLAFPFLVTLPGLVLSLYLAFVSFFVLKTYCIFCISLYLLVFLIFLLLKSFLEIPLLKIFHFKWNWSSFLYAGIIFTIGLYVLYGHQAKYASDYEDFDHQAYLDFHYLPSPVNIDPKGRPYWGRAGAPVTIIEFSDFECPFCKRAAFNLKPRLKDYQKDVAFYFFNYPLDRNCNPYMMRNMHEYSCEAAKAVLCASAQGKFWPYHDELFAHQPKFSRILLFHYARNLNLDVQKLETCMDSEETKNKILADIEAGKSVNVEGTPTLFINGRVIKEWMNPVMLNLVIEEEIKRSKK